MNINQDIENAKQVISAEIKGLIQLKNVVDNEFCNLIKIIYNSKGKVILSGIGKSGLVARKVAATLSSTGTPAFFIHPVEASHGDLGVITKKDIVIVFSNSGQTDEIKDIVYYCKNFSITLVGITSNPDSMLIKNSNIKIILPNAQEATDFNSPTTSSTMAMVLGDALAICLMKKNNFTREEYKLLHPGGKIGASLTKVEEIMHKDDKIPLVKDNALMDEAIIIMTSKRLGCVGVVDKNNNLVGIISDGDLRRNISPRLLVNKVSDMMTKNPKIIDKSKFVFEAINLMNEKKITKLFVLEDKKPIGIISIHDCIRLGFN